MGKKQISDRNFGLFFSGVFLLFALKPLLRHQPINNGLLIFSFVVGLVAISFPEKLAIFNRAWARLGFILQKIVSPLFMAVFYLTLFSFGALLYRLFKKNYLNLKYESASATYWQNLEGGDALSTMKDQF